MKTTTEKSGPEFEWAVVCDILQQISGRKIQDRHSMNPFIQHDEGNSRISVTGVAEMTREVMISAKRRLEACRVSAAVISSGT